MRISLLELFSHRQYTDFPVSYYFDRKTYTICWKEQLEDPQDTPYPRYIPLFRVDEQALQNDYIQRFMGKSAWRKYQEGTDCFRTFMDRNGEWDGWWRFYEKTVFEIAKQWCGENHISFVDDNI